MKLYGYPASDNTLRAEAALRELGLEYEMIVVDFFNGEHMNENFLRLNPRHQVPTLVDGDAVVVESVAIICYLQELYGKDKSLYPKDKKDLAVCMTRIAQVHEKLLPKHILPLALIHKKPKEELTDQIKSLKDELAIWNDYVAEQPYLAGEGMTAADIAAFAFFAPNYELLALPHEEFPNLRRWYERMRDRPAVQGCSFFGPSGANREKMVGKDVYYLA